MAEYEFLNRDLIEGFAYSHIATLNGIPGNEDFDIARMEWGFIPDTWFGKPLDMREKVNGWRRGYKNSQGKFIPGIINPHFITLKDRPYFYMAFVYKPWTDMAIGEHVDTFAIVTTTAKGNRVMEWIHNRKE